MKPLKLRTSGTERLETNVTLSAPGESCGACDRMPKRILIVGNQPRDLKRAAEALKSDGYQVHTAADAAQAVGQILSARPDLILLGTALRGMDELTLAMHLKTDPATRDIRLVAWSAPTARRSADGCALRVRTSRSSTP